jgi:hypothetical protein
MVMVTTKLLQVLNTYQEAGIVLSLGVCCLI